MSIKRILAHPQVFKLFNRLIAADRSRRIMAQEYIKPCPGDALFDIGCGMAEIAGFLPGVRYHGFDISAEYIARAKAQYGDTVTLVNAPFSREHAQAFGPFDIGIAIGLLHHLSDAEAIALLKLVHESLKPGGRFITYDGCYTEPQSPIARYIISQDRGQHVRTQDAYARLIATAFGDATAHIRTDLLRIPYTHIIFECRKGN